MRNRKLWIMILAIALALGCASVGLAGCGKQEAALTGIAATYVQGETAVYENTPLDDLKSGLTVTAKYGDGAEKAVAAADYALSGTLVAGASEVTVTYEGKTDAFNVTVSASALTSITAAFEQTGTVYTTTAVAAVPTKGTLTVTKYMSDGTQAVCAPSEYTLSGTLTAGTATVTVTLAGKMATFNVTVTAAVLTGITAAYAQSGAVYASAPLDSLKSNLTVTKQYNDDGGGQVCAPSEYTLGGTLTAGTPTITVTLTGTDKTATFTPTVTAVALTGITAVYTQGGTAVYTSTLLNVLKNGLEVTKRYNDGATESCAPAEYTLSGTLTAGTPTITVTLTAEQSKTATFAPTVTQAAVTEIAANFTQGAGLANIVYADMTVSDLGQKGTLTVTEIWNDGREPTPTANYALSGTLSAGASAVTVTHGENNALTDTVTVFVTDKVSVWPYFSMDVPNVPGASFVMGDGVSSAEDSLVLTDAGAKAYVTAAGTYYIKAADGKYLAQLTATDFALTAADFEYAYNEGGTYSLTDAGAGAIRISGTGTNKTAYAVKAAAWGLLQAYAAANGYTQITLTVTSLSGDTGVFMGDATLNDTGWYTADALPKVFTAAVNGSPISVGVWQNSEAVFTIAFEPIRAQFGREYDVAADSAAKLYGPDGGYTFAGNKLSFTATGDYLLEFASGAGTFRALYAVTDFALTAADFEHTYSDGGTYSLTDAGAGALKISGTGANKTLYAVKAAAWGLLQAYAAANGYTQITLTVTSLSGTEGIFTGDATLNDTTWYTADALPKVFTAAVAGSPIVVGVYQNSPAVFTIAFEPLRAQIGREYDVTADSVTKLSGPEGGYTFVGNKLSFTATGDYLFEVVSGQDKFKIACSVTEFALTAAALSPTRRTASCGRRAPMPPIRTSLP
ncbi:MAG: bacterial Ig-like domain-containing protein [Clostridiales bacterium]|jgi:hypothetical protein|nr:bacterial Ig-like domain-containing protein [Clostridiales bacterium]